MTAALRAAGSAFARPVGLPAADIDAAGGRTCRGRAYVPREVRTGRANQHVGVGIAWFGLASIASGTGGTLGTAR